MVAFNTSEGWSRDVTEDIARDVLDRVRHYRELPEVTAEFVQRATGEVFP
jgi:hypothetical protein